MEHPLSSPSNYAPYTPPRYTREWVYTFLALAAAFTLYFKIQHPPVKNSPIFPDQASVPQESFWFFVLQLPHPDRLHDREDFHRRVADWLVSLRRAGFHPMLFSDVGARLTKGMLLPEKAVVLSFDEALLTTYKAYAPLLKDFKIPAVLVTSLKPLREGDRGYLSYNTVQKLPHSGSWDVILVDEQARPQFLTPEEIPIGLSLPPGVSPWSSSRDRGLANGLADLHRPRRLYVDARWSGEDLVNRLLAETPVHPGGSLLGARRVMDRYWGVVLSQDAEDGNQFSFQAEADQRSVDIDWKGTMGCTDFQIDFSLEDATGQVWFLLRSTGEPGDSVRVGFYDGRVILKQETAGREQILGTANWPRAFPWKGSILLKGPRLQILRDGQSILNGRVGRTANPLQSTVQMMLYDQLYGAAQARGISLRLTPDLFQGVPPQDLP